MKPIVALDVSIFAVPNFLDSAESASNIVNLINLWAARIETQNTLTITVHDDAVDMLMESNAFPATNNIKALLELHDLDHVFSAKDINGRIFSILNRATPLSEALGLEPIEYEISGDLISEIDATLPVALAEGSKKVIAALSLFCKCYPSMRDIIAIVPSFTTEGASLRFEGSVTEFNADPNRHPGLACTGGFNLEVICIRTPTELLSNLNPHAVWRTAINGKELYLAIALKAKEKLGLSCGELPLRAGRDFAIGTEFFQTLANNQAAADGRYAGVALERCGTIVADNTALFERDFSAARATDKASSRRVHLTKLHEALRIMFWEKTSGAIEFANVGHKHELQILEGNSAGAFEGRL